MKPLYSTKDFNLSKSIDKLPFQCYYCNDTFYKKKKYISHELLTNKGEIKYCSLKCSVADKTFTQIVNCKNCGAVFLKTLSNTKKSPNHFCSSSCAATYNNKNKTTGNRRSKLEKYLEEQLSLLYPSLEIHYNQKSAIKSELDIYIPSLNLAFELNGIFHYEPIYGLVKLNQIKSNDISKSKACHDARIDLCIIDTSHQKYVKPSTSQKYLDIITDVIKERLLTS